MRPNWFIGLPVQVDISLPAAPPRVRLFAPEDRHMTVAFLGSVDAAHARSAWTALGSLRRPVLGGVLRRIKLLGSPRKPSAITALVDEGVSAALEMTISAWRPHLFDAAGVPHDVRPPLPHVTLARVQRRSTREEYIAARDWARSIHVEGVSFRIGEVGLYTWSENRRERLFEIVEHRAIDRGPSGGGMR